MCCVLGILREQYWDLRKILGTVISLAAATTGLDAVGIEANLGINIALVIAAIKLLYKNEFWKTVSDAISGSTLVVVIEMFTTYLLHWIDPAFMDQWLKMLVYLFCLAAFFCGLALFARSRRAFWTYYQKYYGMIGIVCLNFLFVQLAELYNWNETDTVDISILVLVSITVFSNMVLALKLIKNQQQKEELENQKRMADLKESFLQQMAAEQHEFAKHLQTVQIMISDRECVTRQVVSEYIEELIHKRNAPTHVGYVGDGVLSGFLNQKQKDAEKRKIRFHVLIAKTVSEFPCSQTELIELVGNLLDNAFEAVEQLEGKHRKVLFEIGRNGKTIFLQTVNDNPGNPIKANQMVARGVSTKKGHLRGYGLFNVKTIAEQHGGKLEIRQNEDIVMVKIYFINSSGQSGSP
ncbi:MAG: GHKL domain-containing protein [Firmicutes bacterium]|nr:GHKL domain-containing protein [Bacillota bacterium]